MLRARCRIRVYLGRFRQTAGWRDQKHASLVGGMNTRTLLVCLFAADVKNCKGCDEQARSRRYFFFVRVQHNIEMLTLFIIWKRGVQKCVTMITFATSATRMERSL
jgi:hypothetical protein